MHFTALCVLLFVCTIVRAQNPENALTASVEVLNQKDASVVDATHEQITELEDNLLALYELCRQDEVCASKFFMSNSAVAEPRGNDAARRLQTATNHVEQTKFMRLMVLWQIDDECPLRENALRPRIYLSDYGSQDAAWWLTMLRTARFCGDNQVWYMGNGCVTKRDRLNTDGTEVNPENSSVSLVDPWAVLAIVVFGLIVIAVIVYALMEVQKQFALQKKYIDAHASMWNGESPAGTLGHKLIGEAIDDAESDTSYTINALQGAHGY